MKTDVIRPGGFEFCFPQIDTLVLVEVAAETVTIRATRDTFSEPRKLAFVRELASEGFIPGEYRWLAEQRLHERSDLHWIVDYHWLTLSPELLARPRRFVLRLLAGATVGWCAMMAVLFLGRFP